MATIEIRNIELSGVKLFEDCEGFMDDLSEDIIYQVKGGLYMSELTIFPTTENTIINPINHMKTEVC